MNKGEWSPTRVTIELILFFIGLIAGMFLLMDLTYNPISNNHADFKYIPTVIHSLSNFNQHARSIIITAAIFLLAIRFIIIIIIATLRGDFSSKSFRP